MRKANGRVDNEIVWLYPNGGSVGATVTGLAIDTMSQWLDALAKDSSTAPAIDKVVRAKPKAAVDGCFTADGTRIDEPLSLTAKQVHGRIRRTPRASRHCASSRTTS